MAILVINRRGITTNVLAQSILGVSPNAYRLTPGVRTSAPLTFQIAILSAPELVALESGTTTPLTEEQIQLLGQYRWDQAPSWANYAAVDSGGAGNWFAAMPVLDEGRGRWVFNYGDFRNWPMYSTVKLFRGWRRSLVHRPTGGVPEVAVVPPMVTPGVEGTIYTDAISYIEAGLGNMQVVPDPTPTPASTPTPAPPVTTTVPGTGSFDDSMPFMDTSLWQAANWSNGDPFLNSWHPNQVSFQNGSMEVSLVADSSGLTDRLAVSGEYRTTAFHKYGLYKARMMASNTPGTINGFFTYTGPAEGAPHDEIDVEIKGDDTTYMQVNYWTAGVEHPTVINLGFDASLGMHDYAFRWSANKIQWYVDNVLVHEEDGTRGVLPSHEGKVILNHWGTVGTLPWSTDYVVSTTPSVMVVDNVSFLAEPTEVVNPPVVPPVPPVPPPVNPNALSATVAIEVSNDAIAWSVLRLTVVTQDTSPIGFSEQVSWPYIRAKLVDVSGQNAFVIANMAT